MSTLAITIHHNFGSPSHGNQRRDRNKRTQIEKEVKLSLFIDDMILYIENLKNLPENYYSKSINIVMSHDIKAIQKKSLTFLYTNNEN